MHKSQINGHNCTKGTNRKAIQGKGLLLPLTLLDLLDFWTRGPPGIQPPGGATTIYRYKSIVINKYH
jgi:hypothetical protein